MLYTLRLPICVLLRRLKCSATGISFYRESFSRRMAMAGLKRHHRIAIGVSGGPDSMALCALTAWWKSEEPSSGTIDALGYLDGLLGIIVDHGLRPESSEEARVVQERVMKMGIRCKIGCCNWSEGRPKLGHLLEASRQMRYHIFQEFCLKEKINILLVAHHADDQAELFILRLSRNSGVLGLAGMPFVSQLFLQHSSHWWSGSGNHLILLVRPMLEFAKDDIYKICHGGQLTWVEDPTNQNSLFARNRIRISLGNLPSSSFSSEIQKFISACRLTRTVIENSCRKMLKRCVSVMDEGYTIINLEKLDPLNINDLYLSKFLDMVLQFTSQRLRPIRGSAMRLLLGYVRSLPCKTSLTAAGCYLCAAPRSKGTKMIITCLPEASLPSKILLPPMHCQQSPLTCTTEQIISDAVSFSDQLLGEASCIPFLHARSSEAILREAVQLKLISEPTCASIQSLQMEERENFISKKEAERQYDSLCRTKVSSSSNLELYPGQSCHFMCRFLITWKLHNGEDAASVCKGHNKKSVQSWEHFCESCAIAQERRVKIRHMVDADWLYLAELSKSQAYGDDVNDAHTLFCQKGHNTTMERHCSCLMRSNAQEALHNLKSIPAAARRALPVLASSHDLPVSIPSIGFNSCPCLQIDAEFMPRVPLGGGYSSYL